MHKSAEWGEFIRAFNSIAKHRHRYEVFRDFVTMSALSLHNAMRDFLAPERYQALEEEFLSIKAKYKSDEFLEFSKLLGRLIILLEPEPRDILGGLYMELDLGNTNTAQFFTPPELSEMMAKMVFDDQIKRLDSSFVTLSEPACGAGGMILAFIKLVIAAGHNPANTVWVQAVDVDRVASLMCYIQMALWHVPGMVVVGNSLSLDVREVFYTPAHYLHLWSYRLRKKEDEHQETSQALEYPIISVSEPVVETPPRVTHPKPNVPQGKPSQGQFDFGF